MGQSVELHSVFSQNTSQYFCWPRISTFAEHLSLYLETRISVFAEHVSVFLQETSQHVFRTPFSIFAEISHSKVIKRQSCHHIENSQLICSENQLTGFYMITTLAFNESKSTSQYFVEIISHYFCLTLLPPVFLRLPSMILLNTSQ